jgi:hypothetical protein
MNNYEEKPKKKSPILTILLITLFFALGIGAGYFAYDYLTSQGVLDKINDPEYVSQLQEQQIENTLSDLREIMLLPDEQPTIATLVDVEALKEENPEFYKNAKNGDLLVIYSEKAILFREDDGKIINVAPVFLEPAEGTTEEATESTETEDSQTESLDSTTEETTEE